MLSRVKLKCNGEISQVVKSKKLVSKNVDGSGFPKKWNSIKETSGVNESLVNSEKISDRKKSGEEKLNVINKRKEGCLEVRNSLCLEMEMS